VKLSVIAGVLGCSVSEDMAHVEITKIASPEQADECCITFVSNPKFQEAALKSSAPVVIVKMGVQLQGKYCLEVADPYCGFAKVAQLFEDTSPAFGPGIHPTAYIDATATVHPSAHIGPLSIVGPGSVVGEATVLGAHTVIENNVRIGSGCRIDSHVVIRRECIVGNRVIIQSGAIIGGEGFGNAREGDHWIRIPSFGTVIIEDDAEIGANTTVDRGALNPTIIGNGVKIDNLVMIAHNVVVGENSAIVSQAGLAGSTIIGNRVVIGGQAGFAGHLSVGDDAFIGAQAGVSNNVEAKAKQTGTPSRDLMTMRRIDGAQHQLPEALREIKRLRKELDEIKQTIHTSIKD
jgi:UDP-3-O-[3-hydroxymyristoyl] glucosamine N-acyltransferase